MIGSVYYLLTVDISVLNLMDYYCCSNNYRDSLVILSYKLLMRVDFYYLYLLD